MMGPPTDSGSNREPAGKPPPQTLVRAVGLRVAFGDLEVLRDVTLEVAGGQFVSVIGPNGAGKSTLLKALVGLIKPAAGQVELATRRFGYVPQQAPVDPGLPVTVAEFLSLRAPAGDRAARPWFGPDRHDRRRIGELLGEIGADHLAGRRLGELSGGEFQRVLVAFALMNDPELLLMDEPLAGVDIRGGMSFDRLLHHLHDDRGMAILMVSHDLHLVEHQSDFVYCLNRALCCAGHPDEILKPENLARAYGHLPGRPPGWLVRERADGAR